MTDTPHRPAITIAELDAIARDGVPIAAEFGIAVEALDPGSARLRLPYKTDFVRPGGTVAGPVLFALADYGLYCAVLSLIGRVELAVTTSMTINFLRRPAPRAVIAEARLLKLGKRLAYGEVTLYTEGDDQPVAHVTGTYSIPPHPPVAVEVPHHRFSDDG